MTRTAIVLLLLLAMAGSVMAGERDRPYRAPVVVPSTSDSRDRPVYIQPSPYRGYYGQAPVIVQPSPYRGYYGE